MKNYFLRVKDHHDIIQRKKNFLKYLEKYTSLYTNLQKTLLNKYQKKNATKII